MGNHALTTQVVGLTTNLFDDDDLARCRITQEPQLRDKYHSNVCQMECAPLIENQDPGQINRYRLIPTSLTYQVEYKQDIEQCLTDPFKSFLCGRTAFCA